MADKRRNSVSLLRRKGPLRLLQATPTAVRSATTGPQLSWLSPDTVTEQVLTTVWNAPYLDGQCCHSSRRIAGPVRSGPVYHGACPVI
jgi:hypothetical protein